jgi:hypothetical protein
MPDYSLLTVDYQPDFGDYSLVPVDHDPFAEDGVTHQAQFQQPQTPTQPAQPQPQTQPQQPATGASQPGVNGPATGNSPSGSGGGAGVGNAGSDPSNPTWAQGWSIESSPFGGYSNPTPTQPLTDDQQALIRQKIVESAQKHIGSPAWDFWLAKGTYPEGTDKCNLFVYEMLTGAGGESRNAPRLETPVWSESRRMGRSKLCNSRMARTWSGRTAAAGRCGGAAERLYKRCIGSCHDRRAEQHVHGRRGTRI